MVTVLAVAAERREFDGFRQYGRNYRRLKAAVDFAASMECNGARYILVANGPGPQLAGIAMEQAAHLAEMTAVVSTGFCGAVDPALREAEVIVGSEVVEQREKRRFQASMPQTQRSFLSGSMVSLDRVVLDQEEKARLRAEGFSAVDMEAAAVALGALQWKVPFYCVRVVTDRADEGFALDFNALRDAGGRFSRPRIVLAAARRPVRLIPELVRIDARCRMGAKVLGDFLADCRF